MFIFLFIGGKIAADGQVFPDILHSKDPIEIVQHFGFLRDMQGSLSSAGRGIIPMLVILRFFCLSCLGKVLFVV